MTSYETKYDIQIEFGDIGNILAYISIGDRIQDIERLVGALADIKRLYSRDGKDLIAGEYIQPELVTVVSTRSLLFRKKSLTWMILLDKSVENLLWATLQNPYLGSW